MAIKAIVFDYGQVISFPQDPAALDRIAEKAGMERNVFEGRFWELRGEYDRGTVTAREYYRQVFAGFDVRTDENAIDEIAAIDSASWKSINPATVALMEDVKKAGCILGILSNMPRDFLAWARQNIPAFSLPHVSLFSCEVNLIKPEKAIYEKLLSMLNAAAGNDAVSNGAAGGSVGFNELVFFDDNPENIKSARSLGIEAFLWTDPENARRELRSLGVKL